MLLKELMNISVHFERYVVNAEHKCDVKAFQVLSVFYKLHGTVDAWKY